MAAVRALVMLLLVASATCFGFYALTGNLRARRIGLVTLGCTLAAALLFFAVMIIDRP
jgi:hypothetical protein